MSGVGRSFAPIASSKRRLYLRFHIIQAFFENRLPPQINSPRVTRRGPLTKHLQRTLVYYYHIQPLKSITQRV